MNLCRNILCDDSPNTFEGIPNNPLDSREVASVIGRGYSESITDWNGYRFDNPDHLEGLSKVSDVTAVLHYLIYPRSNAGNFSTIKIG